MLDEYKKKRDFEKTAEPQPAEQARSGALTFVIQKHAARRLHFDFRLELDGVLKSWAVPQGPSVNPAVKRLAVMVEDHPIDYSSFEGVIPRGEYGAGQVIVWDKGTYSPDEGGRLYFDDRAQAEKLMREGLEKGKLSFTLRGDRLKGSWTLVKFKRGKDDWLLIKHRDEFAGEEEEVQEEQSSVVSGMTIEDLKKKSNEPARPQAIEVSKVIGAEKADFPETAAPMLAVLKTSPFSDPRWIFEPKLDGFRIIALVQEGKTRLLSRNGLDVTAKYPVIVQTLDRQRERNMVLDGEMVALENGHTCFQCLQNHFRRLKEDPTRPVNLVYYVFDILFLEGYDLRNVPLMERKALLEKAFTPAGPLHMTDYYVHEGTTLFEASIAQGFEGVMAKKMDSTYESGKRSTSWLKVKSTLSDEFVIGGYTGGAGNRENTFGALLLGQFNNQGKLVFTGRVGSGFNEKSLKEMLDQLNEKKTDLNPFLDLPRMPEKIVFVRPELIAEVKFAEWTHEHYLRAPVFMRLRPDKAPPEVRLQDITRISPGPSTQLKEAGSSDSESIIRSLNSNRDMIEIDIEGERLNLTNLGKVLWPQTKNQRAITKRDYLLFLAEISSYILPHLKDRPITLSRYPDGIQGQQFYQKHADYTVPGFVKRVMLYGRSSGTKEYMVCNNLATLLWLGQLADLELHAWYSRISNDGTLPPPDDKDPSPDTAVKYPDFIVFDIDPYIYSGKEAAGAEPELNRLAFRQTCRIALQLKSVLDGLSLSAFVKTSGKTGLHVFVPIERHFDYKATHAAAETICTYLNRQHPEETTIDWAVEKRQGKIFLDYNQNVQGKTLASVYSARTSGEATVSTPLDWDELENVYPTDFRILNIMERLAVKGDIWAGILEKRGDLGRILGISTPA